MTSNASGSKLVPIGVLLILLGFGIPIVLGRLMTGQPISVPLALAIDGFRLGFFVGLALLIIGLVRNRQSKKTSGSQT